MVAFTLQRRRREYAVLDFRLWTFFIRFGLACTTPVVNATASESGAGRNGRQASGTINLIRQLGAAFGMNCVVAFMETGFHSMAMRSPPCSQKAVRPARKCWTRPAASVGGEVAAADRSAGALHYFGEIVYTGRWDTRRLRLFMCCRGESCRSGYWRVSKNGPADRLSLVAKPVPCPASSAMHHAALTVIVVQWVVQRIDYPTQR